MKAARGWFAFVVLAASVAWAPAASARKMIPESRPNPAGKVHACADAARATALQLLRLHSDNDDRAAVQRDIRKVAGVRAPKGKGRLDVLEVRGFVYKAEYRIRVLYLPQGCARVGFELVEVGAGR